MFDDIQEAAIIVVGIVTFCFKSIIEAVVLLVTTSPLPPDNMILFKRFVSLCGSSYR